VPDQAHAVTVAHLEIYSTQSADDDMIGSIGRDQAAGRRTQDPIFHGPRRGPVNREINENILGNDMRHAQTQ
jgi:hypothetical protein